MEAQLRRPRDQAPHRGPAEHVEQLDLLGQRGLGLVAQAGRQVDEHRDGQADLAGEEPVVQGGEVHPGLAEQLGPADEPYRRIQRDGLGRFGRGGFGRCGWRGLAGWRLILDKRDLVGAELAYRLLYLGFEGVVDDGAEVGPGTGRGVGLRDGRGGRGGSRRAEDPAEPRLVRGVAGSAADQPGGQVRQRAAYQVVVQSHVMDEAIDRYVGGVKHVTMNVYI